MRYCLLLLLALSAIRCATVKPPSGPFVLHVWIYYGHLPAEVQTLIDSSHCPYRMRSERESDGVTRVEFSFTPDPRVKRLEKIFGRLQRNPAVRGFATTRGEKGKVPW